MSFLLLNSFFKELKRQLTDWKFHPPKGTMKHGFRCVLYNFFLLDMTHSLCLFFVNKLDTLSFTSVDFHTVLATFFYCHVQE